MEIATTAYKFQMASSIVDGWVPGQAYLSLESILYAPVCSISSANDKQKPQVLHQRISIRK